MPYISTLQSLSKQRIFDPVPEIREMASRILAAVLCKSDIQNTKEILSWLAERIVDDKNNITRLGAAQCTCEIAYACGDNLLRDHMEIALYNIEGGSNHYVVHGYYAFCLFVSKRSFDVFSKFLMRIMPCILRSLADEVEIVRDAAYNVGQSMVDLYFDECADKLLPEIEEHLFASDWRIRFSSLKLMSEMLFKIVGQVEQSEGSQSDRCYTVLTKFLGQDRIDRILTELFIFCNDQVSQVAQYSMHTWKVIITNTSMVLNQIMPTFLTCIFERLSQSQDNLIREIIARALGDLIRRLGDVSFEKVLLIILEQISSKNQQCLEGSCSALKEIFSTCSKDILISQFEQVSDLLKKLLCDSDPTVRDLAAQAFLQFDQVVGRPRIADFFLPNYIEYISSEIEKDSEHKKNVIDGFVKMLQCTGTNFVNYALNVLLRSKNLSMDLLLSACEVSGSSGFKYINHIVHCVMDDLSKAEPGNKDIAKAATTLANITNSETLLTVVNMLCDKCNEELDKFDENTFNCDSVILLNHFIKLCESNSKLSEATHQIERLSFRLCSFRYEILNNHTCFEPAEYLRNMWAAGYDLIEQFIKRMSFNDYVKIFASLDQSIRGLRYVKPMVNSIPGWNIKGKGFKPIMHVYRELIHNHDEQVKDSVMASLLKLLYLCGNDSIRVSSFSMIGSIIRILGERQSDQSRFLMLSILNKLLPAIGDHLKMFVPQLLPTFTRFLPCQHVDVFKQALIGFRLIAPLKPRCEYLLRDVYPTIMSYPDSKLDDLHNNHEDFLQLLEQTWKGVFTIVICFEFSEISLTTEQVDQLQGILNRARFLSSLSTEFDMNDSPFSDGSKNISQAVILTCRRLKRLCGALDFILSYINEDLAQIKTDWNNNPVAKYLERRLAQLSVNADVCEALSSICVLFHRFPLVVNHRGDHINKLESLCAHVYLKSEFQIDFLRTLGFLTLARYSVPKEEPAVQKRFNTLSTDFLAKIIVSNSAANNFPLAVDFALRSLSCTNVNDTLARSVIALAISTKPEQAKTKAHCLDTMIVTLQYPNKFIERLTKLRMIPSNDNPVGSADTLNALSNEIQKRYTECGYPALYLYNDCAELFGWI
ncbi:hypothetical protein GJ496_002619 [Pomphorhynchus laevis]|nr:hypothetical protein GJ496_002619 [Pomphorhynchus laevis]